MFHIKDIADDFLSLFLPRPCLSCGVPLARGEEVLCTGCMLDMARTDFHLRRGNMLEQAFWAGALWKGQRLIRCITAEAV